MRRLLSNISFDKWFDVFVGTVIECSVALIHLVWFEHCCVVAALIGSVVALSITVLEEVIKSFIPGRRAFIAVDMFADIIGFVISFILSWTLLYIGGV